MQKVLDIMMGKFYEQLVFIEKQSKQHFRFTKHLMRNMVKITMI